MPTPPPSNGCDDPMATAPPHQTGAMRHDAHPSLHQTGATPQLPPQPRHLYPLPIKWARRPLPGPSNRHDASTATPALLPGTPRQMGMTPTLPSIKQARRPNGCHSCSSSNGHDAPTAASTLPLALPPHQTGVASTPPSIEPAQHPNGHLSGSPSNGHNAHSPLHLGVTPQRPPQPHPWAR